MMILGAAWAVPTGCKDRSELPFPAVGPSESSVAEVVEDRWLRAERPRMWQFPDDHGPHPDYRIEWWYYTGNLWDTQGRRYGYQLTFFRTGIRVEPANPSSWAVRDIYIAHLAVSDVNRRRHRFWQRVHRKGPGWAGAERAASRVWNGDWELSIESDPSGCTTRHILKAQADDFRLDLELLSVKELVLHGEQGLSRKGSSPGNASYYYSFTRLETKGQLELDGKRLPVRGESWMDHEFSSSFLEESQEGWDWFSIQLADGTELMLYQIRQRNGQRDPAPSGTMVYADGRHETLSNDQFRLEPGHVWKSPGTGGRYPMQWKVELPQHGLSLNVHAVFEAQEMQTQATTGMAYWEGAVDVHGFWQGRSVKGYGYLEMTGRVPASDAP